MKKHLLSAKALMMMTFTGFLTVCWSLLSAQTVATNFTNNNGSSVVIFSFVNTNTDAVLLSEIGSVAGASNTYTAHLYARTVTYNSPTGVPNAVTGANGWSLVATNNSLTVTGSTTSNVASPFISGMSYLVPGLTQVQFALQTVTGASQPAFTTNAGSTRYSNVGTQTCTFSNSGCEIRACSGYGYGGTMAAPTFSPRGFIGYINFTSAVACAGAPSAANTISSATSVCVGENFNLTLSSSYNFSGITYQWQSSSDNMAWSDIPGATSSALSTTQTADTYYRCVVTCTNSGLFIESSSVQVTQNTPTSCYCTPAYVFGTDAGDLISAVSISGTTLDNNVGFTAGQPSYLDFFNSVVPNETGTMNAGSSYTVTVSTGEWGDQGVAAWIDFNNNGVFEPSEKIGNTSTVIGSGFTPGQVNATANFVVSLPCNPSPGDYRMRVRCAWLINGPALDPCASYNYGQAHDYKITVAPPPPCPSITGLAAGTPGSFNVVLNWNQGCAESAWNVEYGAPGFTPGTGTTVPAGTNIDFDLNGLMASTDYDIYVSADCGVVDGVSAPFGPVSITTDLAPCAGTPAASNTLSSSAVVCIDENFTLTLSETYDNLGITYQWQSSADNMAWTDIIGATTLELTTTQTADTYYRCIVTCTNSALFIEATSVQVTMGNPTDCYCIPEYSFGTDAGDLISAVEIAGTTLNNNVGFTAGQPSYLDFFNSVVPNETGTMNAGTSYTVTVSTGEWGDQGIAAWIDFNGNGVFETSEKIGNTATVIGTGFTAGQVNATASFNLAIPCNPTPGDYRMRIRGAYFVNGPDIDPCALYGFGQTHDYKVTIGTPPPCPMISNLTATNVTSDAADLNWNIGCAETAWDIHISTSATPPVGAPDIIGHPTNSYSATMLMPETEYFAHVRANCGGGDGESDYFTISFTTLPLPPPCASNMMAEPDANCDDYPLTFVWDTVPEADGYLISLGTTPGGNEIANNFDIGDQVGIQFIDPTLNTTYYWTLIPYNASGNAVGCLEQSYTTGAVACACFPVYDFGKIDGDLISDVEITGTTLSNNTGTDPENPYFEYFTGQPNYTADLLAGGSYTLNVTYGDFAFQNCAAWIDFNDNDVYEISERIGFTTSESTVPFETVSFPITIGSSPTLGTFRMRIRNVFGVDGIDIDPCLTYGFGETEEYDVTIVPAPPGTVLNTISCGATNVTMNQLVNAVTVPGALQYRFRITGTNSQGWPLNQFIYTSNSKNFRFQFIPGAMWGETYGVEVAYSEVPDVFGPYGSSCDVTLQDLASQPLSSVNAATCGSTVQLNTNISTPWVPGALGYRYQIVGNNAAAWSSNTFVAERPASPRQFKFNEIPGALYGETYAVSVAYQDGSGNWTAYGAPCNITIETPSTQLEVGDCGAIGVEGNDFLLADNVIGASGYRFRITGNNNAMWVMDQIEVDRNNRVFWMGLANGWLPGETYTIEVAVQDAAGNYGAYGSACSVTMAGTPTIEIINVDTSINTKATIQGLFGATASHNPFTRDFGLSLVNANDTDEINVSIYDMSGKLIEANSVNPMDIESARFGANLAAGMYMIQVNQGANQAIIRQVKN